jgi:hypothetical protein
MRHEWRRRGSSRVARSASATPRAISPKLTIEPAETMAAQTRFGPRVRARAGADGRLDLAFRRVYLLATR